MTEDLVAWLRARLDHDERVAREALHGPVEEPWFATPSPTTGSDYDAVGQRGYGHREPDADGLGTYVVADFGFCGGSKTAYFLRFQPRRVLAEVEAKRRLIDEIGNYEATIDGEWGCCHSGEAILAGECVDRPNDIAALRLLALPYSDLPGYREEWRP